MKFSETFFDFILICNYLYCNPYLLVPVIKFLICFQALPTLVANRQSGYNKSKHMFFRNHTRSVRGGFMKGSTHLAIGCAIGAASAGYHSFGLTPSILYIAVASVSSLIPDLDGPSMLSSKIGKASKAVYRAMMTLAAVLTLLVGYMYFTNHALHFELVCAALCTLLPALIVKEGFIRNAMVSLVGAAIAAGGFVWGMLWLSGFGLFIVIAPWLKHRGLTHTVWALWIWYLLSLGMEQQLGIEGLALTAGIGYASHLLADTLTVSGVKWLYPLTKFTFKLPFR
jgi:inner membrane protein